MRVDSDSEISLLTLAEREMQVRLSRGRIQVWGEKGTLFIITCYKKH
jgi:hypothetical protein